MGVTFSQIVNNTASCSFNYGDDHIEMSYYPNRITEKTFGQLNDFAKASAETLQESFAEFNGMLATLVKSWNLFEDVAETIMFPLDPERLAELPIAFRMQAMNAILGDVRPELMAPQANHLN